MELDSSLALYMQKRAECAKNVACIASVQCFAIAVFFCAYALLSCNVVYSKSLDAARIVIIVAMIIISIVLAFINVSVCIRCKNVSKSAPDFVAIRQSYDTVCAAYKIARPVLIYQITAGCMVALAGGLIYILLITVMGRVFLAGIYGRIITFIACAVAFFIIIPSLDRIASYRFMLNELHETNIWEMMKSNIAIAYGTAILVPALLCAWFILRFYTNQDKIAWIVFPVGALFGLAIIYLIGFSKDYLKK